MSGERPPTASVAAPRPSAPRGRRSIEAAAAAALLALALVVACNPRLRWDVVARYLFSREVLDGLAVTLQLTVCAMMLGSVGGLILALMRLSRSRPLAAISIGYVWLFRGTPVLVQLLFWFNIEALYPDVRIPIGAGAGLDMNALVTPLAAAIIGLGLNEAAYMAEIVRAGIVSVDPAQARAARSLGMTPLETLGRIVLPQALRVIVPPAANEAIGLLKTSSIASVIAVTELLYATQLIYSVNYLTVPLLVVASLWYLAVTSVLSIAQHRLERHLDRRSSIHAARA